MWVDERRLRRSDHDRTGDRDNHRYSSTGDNGDNQQHDHDIHDHKYLNVHDDHHHAAAHPRHRRSAADRVLR